MLAKVVNGAASLEEVFVVDAFAAAATGIWKCKAICVGPPVTSVVASTPWKFSYRIPLVRLGRISNVPFRWAMGMVK
jgi:hypothetical protein